MQDITIHVASMPTAISRNALSWRGAWRKPCNSLILRTFRARSCSHRAEQKEARLVGAADSDVRGRPAAAGDGGPRLAGASSGSLDSLNVRGSISPMMPIRLAPSDSRSGPRRGEGRPSSRACGERPPEALAAGLQGREFASSRERPRSEPDTHKRDYRAVARWPGGRSLVAVAQDWFCVVCGPCVPIVSTGRGEPCAGSGRCGQLGMTAMPASVPAPASSRSQVTSTSSGTSAASAVARCSAS
jgi:hypothetical protein